VAKATFGRLAGDEITCPTLLTAFGVFLHCVFFICALFCIQQVGWIVSGWLTALFRDAVSPGQYNPAIPIGRDTGAAGVGRGALHSDM